MLPLASLATLAAAMLAVADAANCTSTEAEAIAKLDSIVENAPECARLNSLVAGDATIVQICSDATCIKIVKKAATQVPDCLVNGESAKRLSVQAFTSCDAPADNGNSSTPTSSPTPETTTKAPSTAGSIGSDSDTKAPTTVTTPAPTTKAPDSAATSIATPSVIVATSAALLYAAWM